MRVLSDRHVKFAYFSKKTKCPELGTIGVPYILINGSLNAQVNFLNKAITKISFQYGPIKIRKIRLMYMGIEHYGYDVFVVTLSRDMHTNKQWTKILQT